MESMRAGRSTNDRRIEMRARAFTLIELLIVVAIIAILAAIAVPNFLAAQTRGKLARMQADLSSLSLAIEAYRVDQVGDPRQPPCNTLHVRHVRIAGVDNSRGLSDCFSHRCLSFGGRGCSNRLPTACATPVRLIWYVWSFAPDGINQHGSLLYDPSNGTVSPGDIKRTTAHNAMQSGPQ